MRSYTLLLLFLSGLLFQVSDAQAQRHRVLGTRLFVHTPASVEGFKEFSISNDGTASASNWGGAVTSAYVQLPLIKAVDSLACGTLTNGTGSIPSLTGNIALVYRGDCSFVNKAHFAQVAGAAAVVIVNNVDVPSTISMSEDQASPYAGTITIPVIMISKADGDALNQRLLSGDLVFVSITNWGFDELHDLAIVPRSGAVAHNMAIPAYQLLDNENDQPIPYGDYLSAIVANTGSSTELDVKLSRQLSFTPAAGGSSTLLLDDTLNFSSFDPFDSVFIFYSNVREHVSVPSTGKLTYNYFVKSGNNENIMFDNSLSFDVNVTDSIYSKGRFDMVNGRPFSDVSYRHTTAPMLTWGPLYYVQKGGYAARKFQLALSADDDNSVILQSHTDIDVLLFRWEDLNGDMYPETGEFEIVGIATKSFSPADTNNKFFTVPIADLNGNFTNVILNDESWYWAAVEMPSDLFLATDDKTSFYSRLVANNNVAADPFPSLEYFAPMHLGDRDIAQTQDSMFWRFPFISGFKNGVVHHIDSLGFRNVVGRVPAVALHTSKDYIGTSVPEVSSNQSVELFPIPVIADVLNVKITSDKSLGNTIEYKILDGLGRFVSKNTTALNGDKFTVPTAGLSSGHYFLILKTENGHRFARKFTVHK